MGHKLIYFIKMEILLSPFRWYDKYHKQYRFDNDCANTCKFELITDRTHLLPFQFTREASGYSVAKFILRKACTDFEKKMLTEQNSKFYSVNGWVDDDAGFTYDCGIAKSGTADLGALKLNSILTVAKTYTVRFQVMDNYGDAGSLLTLSFFNGATPLITNFFAVGNYEMTFVATSANVSFIQNALVTPTAGTFIGISNVQITEAFEVSVDDIQLDPALITLANYGDYDYFMYCGTSLLDNSSNAIVLPTGSYYAIVSDTENKFHFSEVFTVKNFIPESSPYFILEWSNTCDINNTIYSNTDCEFKNRLYLEEAVLSKPEYPIQEEGQNDGESNFKATFQKWEKKPDLIIGKCPEYLVDSLTAIRLHDTITLITPMRKGQVTNDDAIEIKSVETEITPVFNDCYSNVSVKLLLADNYVDSACCNNNTIATCAVCGYSYKYTTPPSMGIPPVAIPSSDLMLIIGGPDEGLYRYNNTSDEWEIIELTEDVLICGTGSDPDYYYAAGEFLPVPTIIQSLSSYNLSTGVAHIQAYGYPGSYVQIEYSKDSGATWTKILLIENWVVSALIGFDFTIPGGGAVDIRMHNFSLSCDYGYNNVSYYGKQFEDDLLFEFEDGEPFEFEN